MQKRQLLHIALSVLIISVWGVLMVLFASYFTNKEVDKAKSNPEKVSVSDHMKLLDSGTFPMEVLKQKGKGKRMKFFMK